MELEELPEEIQPDFEKPETEDQAPQGVVVSQSEINRSSFPDEQTLAYDLVESLVERQSFYSGYYTDIQSNNVYTKDIKRVLSSFLKELSIIKDRNTTGIIIETNEGDLIPVSLIEEFSENVYTMNRGRTSQQEFKEEVYNYLEESFIGMRRAFYSDADGLKNTLKFNLHKFLQSRIKTLLNNGGGSNNPPTVSPVAPPPKVSFKLCCNKNGLQVNYAPIYLIKTHTTHFGGLTSPVNGTLQPGIFYFGVELNSNLTKWDLSKSYDVPEKTTGHLTV